MRVLILGGDGMLGHRLFQHLGPRHDVRATLRHELSAYAALGRFTAKNSYAGVDVRSLERVVEVLADFHPEVVVNCIGIIKQRPAAKEAIPSLEINALFPHKLATLCKAIRARVIHLTTDCVFSGGKGNYLETDPADAEDLYGRSKFLGEIHDSHCLTLRTSFVGRELARKTELIEWFLAQRQPIKGFTQAIFSGFTTGELSKIIEKMITDYPHASGVYHVASKPISKLDFLMLIKEKMGLPIEIIPDATYSCDRSLDATRFCKEFNYAPPSWESMIEDFKKDLAEEYP